MKTKKCKAQAEAAELVTALQTLTPQMLNPSQIAQGGGNVRNRGGGVGWGGSQGGVRHLTRTLSIQ